MHFREKVNIKKGALCELQYDVMIWFKEIWYVDISQLSYQLENFISFRQAVMSRTSEPQQHDAYQLLDDNEQSQFFEEIDKLTELAIAASHIMKEVKAMLAQYLIRRLS